MEHFLVTGGCGFIGSNFVHLATSQGYRVTNLDAMTYAGHTANLKDLKKPELHEHVEGRIEDEALVAKLFEKHRFDAVIHFAAESHVDRSITGPKDFITTNIMGTFNLLQCARQSMDKRTEAQKAQFRFIQVSTDEVYGELDETGYFTEESKYLPNSPYSASKAAGDLLARAWFQTYGFPVIVTNCSNNYGPRQFPEKLIPRMITQALAGQSLPVYGKGANVRDWIHVEDHCEGILLALRKGKLGETYLFGGGAERRNLDVVRTICSQLDELRPRANGKYEELIEFVTDRLGHDHRYAIDDRKAVESLGFKRRHTFEEGLQATICWYLENGTWLKEVQK